ncbi:sialate O-acetylesterase [Coraliomargarita sp. W4R72]
MQFLLGSLLISVFLNGAELVLPDVFTDGVVLQQQKPVAVWGSAEAGSEVSVRIADAFVTTQADVSGDWELSLPAQLAGGPYQMQIASGSDLIELSDVWYGEVWIAGGQSNMTMTLSSSENWPEVAREADSLLRYWLVPKLTQADAEPVWPDYLGDWRRMIPSENQRISAVGYYFAKDLREALDVPVALIQCNYGGTPAEAWVPKETLLMSPETAVIWNHFEGLVNSKSSEEWRAEYDNYLDQMREFLKLHKAWHDGGRVSVAPKFPLQPQGPYGRQSATVLYEHMLKKVMPFTARGVIWYQGEANANQPERYRILFPNLIERWRNDWDEPNWPFYFVQLSAFEHQGMKWAPIRDVQTWVADNVSNTGMAVTIDIGDENDIHPKRKALVGQRLARHALNDLYSVPMETEGPRVSQVDFEEDQVTVRFTSVAKGVEVVEGQSIQGFEIAANDGKFVTASGRIVGVDQIEFDASGLSSAPVHIRYAWANFPKPTANLYNSEGLPAIPFLRSK